MGKNKKIGKLLPRMALLLVISLVVGVGVYRWNAQKILGDPLPMPLGFGGAVVLSGSMEPALSVDDLLLIRKADSYQVGQIVVFLAEGDLVVHRIVSLEGETVVTQGDANNTPDTPIAARQIKGVVAAAIPGVGKVLDGLRSPLGMVVILAAAVLLLEGSYRREKKADQQELEDIKAQIRALKERE